jgi:hypothetical protein
MLTPLGIALANEVQVRDELKAGTLVRAVDVQVALGRQTYLILG